MKCAACGGAGRSGRALCEACYGTGEAVAPVGEGDTLPPVERAPGVLSRIEARYGVGSYVKHRRPLAFHALELPPRSDATFSIQPFRPFRPLWLVVDLMAIGLLLPRLNIGAFDQWQGGDVPASLYVFDDLQALELPERCRLDCAPIEVGHVIHMKVRNPTDRPLTFAAAFLGDEVWSERA